MDQDGRLDLLAINDTETNVYPPSSTLNVSLDREGLWMFEVTAVDRAGNATIPHTTTFRVDPPDLELRIVVGPEPVVTVLEGGLVTM